MKKIILFMVLAVFCFMANAQDEPTKESDIKFGLKAGLNFSLITGDGTDNMDGKLGFHVGGAVEFSISEQFSIQPELLYSSQGDKDSSGDMEVKFNLDYLNLPVMAKYYVADNFSLEAGPQLGVCLSAKAKGGGLSIDINDLIKDIDFGFAFGLGYRLENGINFSGRYYVGVTNIWESSGSILGETIDTEGSSNQNNVFQLSVGYFF